MKNPICLRLFLSVLLLCAFKATGVAQEDGFDPVNPPEPNARFTVSTQADGQAYTSGGGTFVQGTAIELSTSAQSEDYTFSHWTKNGEWFTDAQHFTYQVEENAVFTAVYDFTPIDPNEPAAYNKYRLYLTTNADGGCSFNCTSGTKVEADTYVLLEAYPSSGYDFKGWYLNGQLIAESRRFYYPMPSHNVELSTRLVFNPVSPGEPGGTGQGDVANSKMGDANGDGEVNTSDAVTIVDYYVSATTTERLPNGDLNGDGEVNASDAVLLIDKYIMGE